MRKPIRVTIKVAVAFLITAVLFVTAVGFALVHYPQRVDAFLNSDEPATNAHKQPVRIQQHSSQSLPGIALPQRIARIYTDKHK
jgi:hypothetical protein